MAQPNRNRVRPDLWICGDCNTSNTIANAPDRCPACGHYRDYQAGCCANPGDRLPQTSGLFPGHNFACDYAPQGTYQSDALSISFLHHHIINSNSIDPNQVGFNDLWICNECGNENCDWCTECPICGMSKAAMPTIDMPSCLNTCGAGSPDPDAWICGSCGSSNSGFFDTHCGACGNAK